MTGYRLGGLHARHRLDLSLKDVFCGLRSCCRPGRPGRLESRVLDLCSVREDGLVCLSVRSGWDLWLGVLDLEVGDEVLVSAVTHPDMVRIIRSHGLRAVPIDIEPGSLAPTLSVLEAALTPRTRVVLVAHLFGGRIDLGPVARLAREHGLMLVEDCAQAFWGPERVRDSSADVSLYSFGTLKTSTALGGAVLRVRDREALHRMRDAQATYAVQPRGRYARKLLLALGLLTVSRPQAYGLLAKCCAWLGGDLDDLVNGAVRAFPSGEPDEAFLRRIRHRPSTPLLAMLDRRLGTFDRRRLARRADAGERFAARLKDAEAHPGWGTLGRTHWLFPVVVSDPGALVSSLRKRGVDASRATSSIAVIETPVGYPPPAEADRMMSGIVFLPVRPDLPARATDAMAGAVNECISGKAGLPVAS